MPNGESKRGARGLKVKLSGTEVFLLMIDKACRSICQRGNIYLLTSFDMHWRLPGLLRFTISYGTGKVRVCFWRKLTADE